MSTVANLLLHVAVKKLQKNRFVIISEDMDKSLFGRFLTCNVKCTYFCSRRPVRGNLVINVLQLLSLSKAVTGITGRYLARWSEVVRRLVRNLALPPPISTNGFRDPR